MGRGGRGIQLAATGLEGFCTVPPWLDFFFSCVCRGFGSSSSAWKRNWEGGEVEEYSLPPGFWKVFVGFPLVRFLFFVCL